MNHSFEDYESRVLQPVVLQVTFSELIGYRSWVFDKYWGRPLSNMYPLRLTQKCVSWLFRYIVSVK